MGLFNFKQKAEIKRLKPTLLELGYQKNAFGRFQFKVEDTKDGYIELSVYIKKNTLSLSLGIEDFTLIIEPNKIIETVNILKEDANNNIYLAGATTEYGLNYIEFTIEVSKIDDTGLREIHSFLQHIYATYKPLIRKAKPGELPFN